MPWRFFAVVLALSIPFWVIGGATGWQLAPGLPVSALGAFCPMLAAALLLYRDKGSGAVAALLKRAFDFARIRNGAWYAPVILLMPAVMAASYLVMRALAMPLPSARFSVGAAAIMFAAFFPAALGEELGWSGYAIGRMQERWSALRAAITLGLVWAAWHLVPLMQAHRTAEWIAWWCLGTVALRVVMVWLYNNTGGSVFGAALFHAMTNVSWLMFPNLGSHYDPRITGLILSGIAAAAVVISGPATLCSRRGGPA